MSVSQTARRDGPLEELTLASDAFDQGNLRRWQGDRKRESRKARPCPEIGDPSRRPHGLELEADEGVCEVLVQHVCRITHRGRRQWVSDEDLEQLRQLRRGAGRQSMAFDERVDTSD